MTTNSTWTTVNGMVMPGSGTQTFPSDCFDNPFGMPGLGGCGLPSMPGRAGLWPPQAYYIDENGDMWVPYSCEES